MSVKLSYFAGRGVVETTRYMLAAKEVEYEDFRYSISFGVPGDFSTLQRPEFDAAKAAGEMAVSMGKVPILEVGGFKIPQSKAIERYVARTYGLMGANDLEAGLIDGFVEHLRDIKEAYYKAKATDDAAKDKFLDETLGDFLKKVDAAVSSPGPFLVGSAVSYADMAWFVFLTEFFDAKDKVAAAMTPKLKAAIDAVAAMPTIQAWKAKRPETPF